MSTFSGGLPGSLHDAGLLLGLLISLAIGSCLIRDNVLARFAQYILVGAGLGYMAVVAWEQCPVAAAVRIVPGRPGIMARRRRA